MTRAFVTAQTPELPLAEKTQRHDPLIGQNLGGYVVKHWLGRGGMGVVYLAEQPDIGKAVAIKVIKQDAADEDQLRRMQEEARITGALRHRGIIDIFGFGTVPDGRPYLVMEFLEGEPLDGLMDRKRKLPLADVLPIMDEVLAAMGVAHKAGVVHRDLKPGNIFLALDSAGTQYVKVLDFGLAKKAQEPYGSASQTAMRPAGTPEYMAPEQALGHRVSPRTDLYSLGVLMYEMLTGQLPFHGPSYVEILLKHVHEPPPSPSFFEAGIPPPLEALILELMQKKPEARPQSAEEARARLKDVGKSVQRANTQIKPVAALLPPPPQASSAETIEGAKLKATGWASPPSETRLAPPEPAPPQPRGSGPKVARPAPEPAAVRSSGGKPARPDPLPTPVIPSTERLPVEDFKISAELIAAQVRPTMVARRRRWVLPALGVGALVAAGAVVLLARPFESPPPPAPQEPVHLSANDVPAPAVPPARPQPGAPVQLAPEPAEVRPAAPEKKAEPSARSMQRRVVARAPEGPTSDELVRHIDAIKKAHPHLEQEEPAVFNGLNAQREKLMKPGDKVDLRAFADWLDRTEHALGR